MTNPIERIDGNTFGRVYKTTIDGIVHFFPSVTNIISKKPNPKLIKMRKEMGDEKFELVRDRAARRGSVMHKWLEYFLEQVSEGRTPDQAIEFCQDNVHLCPEFNGWDKLYPKQLKMGMNLFYNFYNAGTWKEVKTLVASEVFMYTTFRGGWAGAADFIFLDKDDKLVLWDFKSASDMREEDEIESYYLQVASYLFLLQELCNSSKRNPLLPEGVQVDRGEILMMNEKNDKVQRFMLPRGDMKKYLVEFIKYRAIFEEDSNWQAFLQPEKESIFV